VTIPIVIILALAVVALYPLVREFLQRRRTTVPAYVEGLRMVADGLDREAIPHLKDAVKSDPDNIDAWVRLGDAYIRIGEVDRGVKVHENLGLRRNLRPDDERRVLVALARDYERTDRKLKAIATLEELARGRNRDAAEQLLRLYLATGSHDKCRTLIDELKRGERDQHWLAGLVAEYAKGIVERDPEAARAAFQECLRLDPGTVKGRVYFGDFLIERGEPDEALQRWQEVLETAPRSNALVRSRLERALYELGRYDEVIYSYERLLRKVPDDIGLAVALALIHRKKGNYEEAVELLARTCNEKRNELCNATMAALELDRGRTEAAARVIDELVDQLQPGGTTEA